MRFFLGGFWATGEPWSAKSDQFWVDILKPKWNLSYIDGTRPRDSKATGLRFSTFLFLLGGLLCVCWVSGVVTKLTRARERRVKSTFWTKPVTIMNALGRAQSAAF